jgi:triacylglycerol lipase
VASSLWGGEAGYKGTLVGVSHLDLINWTNRLKWLAAEVTGNPRKFNAIAFYLDIAGMERLISSIEARSLILSLLIRYVGERGSLRGGG